MKTVKFLVKCHVFAHSPPGRRSNDKYPVNTSDRSRFVQKYFTALLFGSSGNSYKISASQISVYTRVGTLIVATIYLQLIQN